MEVDLLNLLGKALSEKTEKCEPNCKECICSECKISKKKWICFSIYWPPSRFEEMNEVIREALCKYENQIVMGDLNIDIKVLILTRTSRNIFAIFFI